MENTHGMNYVAELEGKLSVTWGKCLQMSPASATDVAWMYVFLKVFVDFSNANSTRNGGSIQCGEGVYDS